jgi:hypothetical protein
MIRGAYGTDADRKLTPRKERRNFGSKALFRCYETIFDVRGWDFPGSELINAVWLPASIHRVRRPSFLRLTEEVVTLGEPGRAVTMRAPFEHPLI